MSKSDGKQSIVIVGGGGAGVAIARELSQKLPTTSSDYNLILITLREVYVHQPAAIRMAVTSEGALEDSALIPYDSLFVNKFGSVKVGKVIGIESSPAAAGGNVLLEGGEKVAFRYLIVATGSIWEGPLAALSGQKQELLSSVETWRETFQKSKAIAIAGAGSVGLELAGEIRDTYPKKEITIIQASPLPLNDAYPEKFRRNVLRRWRRRGVNFILDDRINGAPEGDFSTVTTAKGQTLNADIVVFARGGKPNTSILKSLGDDVLDGQGFVKVTPSLQLVSHPDIFAAGDIIAFKEQKALAKVPGHVAVIIANILSIVAGKEPKKTYPGTFEAIFVTNGKDHGAGYIGKLWGLTFGDKVVPMLKGRGLFVSQQRTAMGLTA